MKAIRFFSCEDCGHHLRLGAKTCPICHQSTITANRIGPLGGIAVLSLLILVLALAVTAFT